jgi:uncharacterized membrane protein YjjP (DUF1212 family)
MEAAVPTRSYEPADETAAVCLEFGRLLMEAGGSAIDVERVVNDVGIGLGAQTIQMRLGYASLAVTISLGSQTVTRMCEVGAIGVNQRLYHALRLSAARIRGGNYTDSIARKELNDILCGSHHHPKWIVAISVAVACAAFGRLLAADWIALLPIFIASCLAQLFRDELRDRHVNVFLSAGSVAFLGSTLAGFGSRLLGSTTIGRDMIVSVLLLVPGIPAFIAQLDILDGRPTLGSARAIWVMVILIFMTAGVWMAQGIVGEGR